ncbi:MAG: hypothetical protein AB7D29_09590 [Campylobacterales bacterium]
MKKLLFLLLPVFVFASDIKFGAAASLGDSTKEYTVKIADAIDDELGIKLIRNLESKIYEDEAALYAVKNGLIKFAVVRSELFAELGLLKNEEYGYETFEVENGLAIVVQSRFWDSLAKNKRDALVKRIKKLKK